jgi:hypothetical protein
LIIPDAIKSTAGKHMQTRFGASGRSSFKRRDDAQPQPHLRASCALDLPSCSLRHSTRFHYRPSKSSPYWAIRGIFLTSDHILPFHPPGSFSKALERHPATDQLIRACDGGGRPQDNYCALLRTLLLSSLLGMDADPNSRSSPSASSS